MVMVVGGWFGKLLETAVYRKQERFSERDEARSKGQINRRFSKAARERKTTPYTDAAG